MKSLFYGFILIGICFRTSFVQAQGDFCIPNPCGDEQYCISHPPEEGPPYSCIDNGYRYGNCSFNARATCVEGTICSEKDDHLSFRCICESEGAVGDGIRPDMEGTGCELPYKPCTNTTTDCPQYGHCDRTNLRCVCNPGFQGDGFTCTDIVDCPSPVCDKNAECTDIPGSFECVCNAIDNYRGNGTYCVLLCSRDDDCDTPRAVCNDDLECECRSGYSGSGDACDDIDECALNLHDCTEGSECINNDGGYECVCRNGYFGDGEHCEPLPKNCNEIDNPRNGGVYIIDPDGTGKANSFQVECKRIKQVIVTVIQPTNKLPVTASFEDSRSEITYLPDPSDLQVFVNASKFCYQDITFRCNKGFGMFPGTQWIDNFGNAHNNWGSDHPNTCACGATRKCTGGCFCDGKQIAWLTNEEGRIVDKTKLPLVAVTFAENNIRKGHLDVGPLICAQESVGVPKDCDDAKKNYDVKKDTSLYIDVDGSGELEPVLVFCDVEKYDHVGITEIPTGLRTSIRPTTSIEYDIPYTIQMEKILGLIAGSEFCSQTVRYLTINSGLLGEYGGYVVGPNGRLDYFPGADGQRGKCACGATRSCLSRNLACNSNAMDGQRRTDEGVIIDNRDLPVLKVRANVTNGGLAAIVVFTLRCAQSQFGIEPNCEKYRAVGVNNDATYFIDPDGPGGLKPFLAECRFQFNPPLGLTVIHHEDEFRLNLNVPILRFTYLNADDNQLVALKRRSTFCTQKVRVDCRALTLQNAGAISFVPANSSASLDLANFMSTCNDGCDCIGNGDAFDAGTFRDKGFLPINYVNASNIQSQLSPDVIGLLSVGPMYCSETFQSCQDLQKFVNSRLAVVGEGEVINSVYTIDPDGPGGVAAFSVRCQFPSTILDITSETGTGSVSPSDENPIDKCFKVNYKSGTGSDISPEQINALAKRSGNCRQSLNLECRHAPASGFINFTTCAGNTPIGWSGSYGADSCSCGVSGVCDGGRDEKCNCDVNDGQTRFDTGVIRDQDRLPVCQVCLRVAPKSPTADNPSPQSILKYRVGQLICDGNSGTKPTCQSSNAFGSRQFANDEDSKILPTTLRIGEYSVPVACTFYRHPPVGALTIRARKNEYPPEGDKNVNQTITYILLRIDLIRHIVARNEYCSQIIFLFCVGQQNVFFGGQNGFFDKDGNIHDEVVEYEPSGKEISDACTRYQDLCDRCGPPKGYLLHKMENLPVTNVALQIKGVTIVVEDMNCYNIKRSCQEMLDDGNIWFGFVPGSHRRYLIDPDGPLSNFPFLVGCQFDRGRRNGVTVIGRTGTFATSVIVKGRTEPGEYTITIDYRSEVTPKQIKALTDISEFCWQGIKFECKNSPLLDGGVNPDSFYTYYGDNSSSPSFGTGARVNYNGCACGLLGTCKNNQGTCNCDARGPMGVDQGFLSDKSKLPLESITVGGQSTDSQIKISINDLRCGSKRVEPPKNCFHAFSFGVRNGIDFTKSGEFLISPDPENVEPFMVYCDYDKYPGIAVTVVKPDVVPDQPAVDPNTPVEIPYKGPSDEQLRALVDSSQFCYQGVRYDCKGAGFLADGSYWTTAVSPTRNYFWGGGDPEDGVCACGRTNHCGGKDSREGQKNRRCNCDVADDTKRADAGIFTQKALMPIRQLNFVTTRQQQDVNITIGDLMCTNEPLELDECKLGFADCHPLASCVDQKVGYRCVCPVGWQGKTTVIDTTLARANGRECIDDDECSWHICPVYKSKCTNTPGSFLCTCNKGYTKTGPTTCDDINECDDPSLNDCDQENGRCDNLIGSYRCACNRGFRGDGKTCVPVGQCSCFGDPHCLSFDKKWLHFMGDCEYVMAQDKCGSETEIPSFIVTVTHWKRGSNRPGYFSWIKSVRALIGDLDIILDQGSEIFVNSIKRDQFVTSGGLSITKIRHRVTLRSPDGLVIKWDGNNAVDITIPTSLKGQTCGLCGNFNDSPDDDWTVGPACPNKEGEVTQNFELFGQSWIDSYVDRCSANCEPEPPVYPPPCNNKLLVERECGKMFTAENTPFKTCLSLLRSSEVQELKDSCEFDLCQEGVNFRKTLCDFGEIIAEKCRLELNYIVIGWRESTEACEDIQCENNMIYSACSPISPETCLSEHITVPEEVNPSDCMEGCTCQQGYVVDGDRCVPEDECGCVYKSQYIRKNDYLYTPDCSKKVTCLGNNTVERTDYSCGENQICEITDGVIGCYCQEGYIMSPDGSVCTDDPCYNVVCEIPNQECVEGQCVCKEGYIGDCNVCTNVDECATGTADCNRIGQNCTDLDGGFLCTCEKGFIPSEYGCDDINECEDLDIQCGANSECSNTLGGHECECCSGYKKDAAGDCVRDPTTPVSGKCCSCQGEKCLKPGQVCGTDGITYQDYRTLVITACRNPAKKDVKVNYHGICQSSCELVACDKQFATCEMEDGIPKCNCPTCENSTLVQFDQLVCATNKITYNSVCHMKASTCEAELETTVEVETFGRPCGPGGSVPVGPWSEWGDCSENCKQGVRNRTRTVPPGSGLSSIVSIPCFSVCVEGPCTLTTCTGPGQVCSVDAANVPSCSCMDCSEYPEELICGRLGNVIQTYPNECELHARACEEEESSYEVLERRACEDKPKECGLIRNFVRHVDENGCLADRHINVGQCYGGCDLNGEHCCYGYKPKEVEVLMRCNDNSFHRKMYPVIEDCRCLTQEEVENLKSGMNMDVVA